MIPPFQVRHHVWARQRNGPPLLPGLRSQRIRRGRPDTPAGVGRSAVRLHPYFLHLVERRALLPVHEAGPGSNGIRQRVLENPDAGPAVHGAGAAPEGVLEITGTGPPLARVRGGGDSAGRLKA
jgi:hypothetical protein